MIDNEYVNIGFWNKVDFISDSHIGLYNCNNLRNRYNPVNTAHTT